MGDFPLLPNELIDIYLRLWVKMQYFFIIYHSNCSSFSHCELFQIPFMCFRHALISTVFLIKFLLDSTMGYSRLILYFLCHIARLGYFSKDPCFFVREWFEHTDFYRKKNHFEWVIELVKHILSWVINITTNKLSHILIWCGINGISPLWSIQNI